ncbi:hypothetical protein Hanom_Chr09g00792611 [Helianthus anomalus]
MHHRSPTIHRPPYNRSTVGHPPLHHLSAAGQSKRKATPWFEVPTLNTSSLTHSYFLYVSPI